jgi:DNA-binding HxlR family transcriptional regulator
MPGSLRNQATRSPRRPPPRRAPVYNVYDVNCPTRRILEILADKWTSLVIVALAPGTKRFQQLRREIQGVSQKMLTQTLRTLEHDGLVARVAYPTVPPKVEYSLTALGRTLTEPLASLHGWAERHVKEVEAARASARLTGRVARL